MDQKDTSFKRYFLAAGLGAVGGGLLIAIGTKAIPKMMTSMMENMMSQMAGGDCDPAEI